jgi:hypothetical protein
MLKKIILFMSILIFLFSGVFAENTKTKELKKGGPSSAPKIVGPVTGPPSRAQIDILKYSRDEEFIGKNKKKEIGFFEKI